MDFVTHAIIGVVIAELALWNRPEKERMRGRMIGAALGAAPDLGGLPAQFFLSWSSADWPWVYDVSHWNGAEDSWLLIGYWVSHSLILPLVAWLILRHRGWKAWPFLAWASHGMVDVATHTGEWAMWPFFPFPGQIEGWGDAWAWGGVWWMVCILIASFLWYCTSVLTANWRATYKI